MPNPYATEPETEPENVVNHPHFGPILESELDALDREAELQEIESEEYTIILIMEDRKNEC